MSGRKKKHPCRRNAFALLSAASLLSGVTLMLIALITGSGSLVTWVQVVAAAVLSVLFFLAWRFLEPPARRRGDRPAADQREIVTIMISGLGTLASLITTLLTAIALLTGAPGASVSQSDPLKPCQESPSPVSKST